MKVKVLSRNPDEYIRETKKDIHRIQRNYDPTLHPFENCREYVRALNAVKLDRVFAKPFIGALDGHRDSVICLAKHPSKLANIVTGACDGEIKIWDLPKRQCLQTIKAHNGSAKGICFPNHGNYLFSIGDDNNIKQWQFNLNEFSKKSKNIEPANTIVAKTSLSSIDHCRTSPMFATCGEKVDIWDESRATSVKTYSWGVDMVTGIKFNPVETSVLGACASDRSILLYDMRQNNPLRKVILQLRSNALVWNPMEAFVFTVANEDYNLYTFDMRKLSRPINIHKDHIGAVLDLDYSPTGREFVSGSYDKTIRIFPVDKGHSREVYHTKRMQRLTSVLWSLDDKYVMSGSDEMNVRIWKARASEKLGLLHTREKLSLNYADKLRDKFAAFPEIKRIARHRHVPKHIFNGQKEIRTMIDSRKRKEANRRAHSKPGSVPYVPEGKKVIVSEEH